MLWLVGYITYQHQLNNSFYGLTYKSIC